MGSIYSDRARRFGLDAGLLGSQTRDVFTRPRSVPHGLSCRADLQSPTAQVTKGPLPTGEHEDLEILRLAGQGIEHPLDPVVVRENNPVIENDGCWRSPSGKHPGKGKTNQNGDLLLRAARENVEILARAAAFQRGRQNPFSIQAQLRLWPKQPKERLDLVQNGFDVAIPSARACSIQGELEFLKDGNLELELLKATFRRFEPHGHAGQFLLDRIARVDVDRGVESAEIHAGLFPFIVGPCHGVPCPFVPLVLPELLPWDTSQRLFPTKIHL